MSIGLTPRDMAELKTAVAESDSGKPEGLIDICDLAQALAVSVSTVERMIKAGKVPVIWATKRTRRFRLSAVMKALESAA